MQNQAINTSSPPSRQTWRPLHLFNLYRLVIASLFAVFTFSDFNLKSFGEYNPLLFRWVAVLYLLICLTNAITIQLRKPSFAVQIHTQVIIDIIAITLFMHASGGVQSGLGMLIIVAVASGSILMAGRAAMLFAALASLMVLAEHAYTQISGTLTTTAYTQTGLLGAAFFATALLAHVLAKRIKESESLATRRGIDLANMEQLTHYIIQQMQTGVAVIDEQARLWQINESAQKLLNISPPAQKTPLTDICPELAFQQRRWQHAPDAPSQRFKAANSHIEVLPHFAKLDDSHDTLIFIEDTATMRQQAQQLKLASLGRLVGSIAHEIRNPLGAISHANQLLAESENLDKHDLRLTEIIHTNSQRMNGIIENILQMGRRDQTLIEEIQLKPWLEEFISEFCRNQDIATEYIQLAVEPADLSIEFDTSQLHQILTNLCHNGARHSLSHSGTSNLTLKASHKQDNPTPFLDIIDSGPGISDANADHLFEPFFTTEKTGTGLGLYIAKELCECNHAHLSYFPADNGGSCFRITFADPRRRRID